VNLERTAGEDRAADFRTTRWSLVLEACHNQQPEGRSALAELCGIYWYPLYAHVRRRGYNPDDAQDLTQGFFLHLLERDAFAQVDARKGKFRSFLLASLNNFLAAAYHHANAAKRGGGQVLVPLDVVAAEDRYQVESAGQLSGDEIFDARWALTLLDETVRRLQERYASKPQIFEALKVFLVPTKQTSSYEEVAAKLGVSVPAVKMLIHRLRQQYTSLLRQEVARTLSDPAEVDQEIHYLCDVLVKADGGL
jgi:DNA-directed RNA polymerase specialized sigma24 family protein